MNSQWTIMIHRDAGQVTWLSVRYCRMHLWLRLAALAVNDKDYAVIHHFQKHSKALQNDAANTVG